MQWRSANCADALGCSKSLCGAFNVLEKSVKSCHMNVVQSLALTKKNELKAYRAAEEILFLERFP